jgi:hypothetical protein
VSYPLDLGLIEEHYGLFLLAMILVYVCVATVWGAEEGAT